MSPKPLIPLLSVLISLGMVVMPARAQEASPTNADNTLPKETRDLSENRFGEVNIQSPDVNDKTAIDDAEEAWKSSQDFFIDSVGSIEPDGKFHVSPTVFELHAQRGETITQTIYVISANADPTTFYLAVEDYEGTTDPNKSHVLMGPADGEYGARHWANLPVEQFTLNMGERANIKVSFTVPESADPGEHYAAVLVARAPRAAEMEGEAQVSVVSRVGTMFMIDVAGQTKLDGNLEEFSLTANEDDKLNRVFKNMVSKAPARFNLLYKNSGTTHLSVQGTMEITNIFGKKIAVINPDATRKSERNLGTTALSLDKFNILRGSVRNQAISSSYSDREIPLFFGPYKATVILDDGTGMQKTASKSFWYIPFPQTPIILGVVVFLILVIMIKKRINRNKRKSILD